MKRYIPLLVIIVIGIAGFIALNPAQGRNEPNIPLQVITPEADSALFIVDYYGDMTGIYGANMFFYPNTYNNKDEVVYVYLDRHITYGDIAISVSVLFLALVVITYAIIRLPKLWLR